MKSYHNSKFHLQEREDTQVQIFSLLSLGSLRSDGKWVLFSVDRVNVTIFWESSTWMVDEVTQLLSNKNLKEIWGKNLYSARC